MAGFPETGTNTEIGDETQAAGPGSLNPFVMHTKGPGRKKGTRRRYVFPLNWETSRKFTRDA
jgi:hypothetical protein